jgi:hypothetical protein
MLCEQRERKQGSKSQTALVQKQTYKGPAPDPACALQRDRKQRDDNPKQE